MELSSPGKTDQVENFHNGLDNSISIASFMTEALFDPTEGFYATKDPFGAGADFITAPEISQMFGELIGLWLADIWQRAGSPDGVC